MSDLLAKPIDPAHLSAVLARWIAVAPGSQPSGKSRPAGDFMASGAMQAAAGTNGDRTVHQQLLDLQRLVAADDMSARDYCRRLPPSVLGARHADIGRLLDDFEYDQAAILIAARLQQR